MLDKKVSLSVCCILSVISVLCGSAVTFCAMRSSPEKTVGSLYAAAVGDAVFADEDEILPLVELTEGSDMATVENGRALLLSWHRYPQNYVAGEYITVKEGGIWTFTDREIIAWYGENADGVTDWTLRLEQLIGLPQNNGYTHFSGFWVNVEDVIRPAYQIDVTAQMSAPLLDGSALGEYGEWFNENILWSYFTSAYPWTRLGYTYDWADNGTEYGLSEFLILGGSRAEVAFTYTTEETIEYLAAAQDN